MFLVEDPAVARRLRDLLVIDRVEQPDDAAFDRDRVRDRDIAVSRLRIACEMTVLPYPAARRRTASARR